MGVLVIKKLERADAERMAAMMRPVDRLEASAMSGGGPLPAVMIHMQTRSSGGKAAYYNGGLLCCWGRVNGTALTGECNPWMVATDLIESRAARRELIARTRKECRKLLRGFRRGWNMVYEGNKRTIRWLKWAGFEFTGEQVERGGLKFLVFEIKEN